MGICLQKEWPNWTYWFEEGPPNPTLARALGTTCLGCSEQAFLTPQSYGFTHPGWRRGFRTAQSSVTKASKPGGDKLFQTVESPEGSLGTGLRVEPTMYKDVWVVSAK